MGVVGETMELIPDTFCYIYTEELAVISWMVNLPSFEPYIRLSPSHPPTHTQPSLELLRSLNTVSLRQFTPCYFHLALSRGFLI